MKTCFAIMDQPLRSRVADCLAVPASMPVPANDNRALQHDPIVHRWARRHLAHHGQEALRLAQDSAVHSDRPIARAYWRAVSLLLAAAPAAFP